MEPQSSNPATSFSYEDFLVGQKFVSSTHLVDQQQIIAFAAEFDPQPFHTDPEAAKDTMFQGLVASGWHTAAVTMRLLNSSGLTIVGGMIGAGAELTWPIPTRPGFVLQVETEVIELRELRSRSDRGLVTIRSQTKNQHGEVVMTLVARLFVPRQSQ
jgi:acyl dehydratase